MTNKTPITPELVRSWLERWNATSGQLALHEVDRDLNKIDLAKAYLALAEWKPIETVPKDVITALITGGTYTWDGDYGDSNPMTFVALAHLDDGEWCAQANGHDAEYYYKPTHWQPLPTPPGDAR